MTPDNVIACGNVALLGALGITILCNRTGAINTAEDTAGDKITWDGFERLT
jgi:hypothetical protein